VRPRGAGQKGQRIPQEWSRRQRAQRTPNWECHRSKAGSRRRLFRLAAGRIELPPSDTDRCIYTTQRAVAAWLHLDLGTSRREGRFDKTERPFASYRITGASQRPVQGRGTVIAPLALWQYRRSRGRHRHHEADAGARGITHGMKRRGPRRSRQDANSRASCLRSMSGTPPGIVSPASVVRTSGIR
jgi:hypothetical protein